MICGDETNAGAAGIKRRAVLTAIIIVLLAFMVLFFTGMFCRIFCRTAIWQHRKCQH